MLLYLHNVRDVYWKFVKKKSLIFNCRNLKRLRSGLNVLTPARHLNLYTNVTFSITKKNGLFISYAACISKMLLNSLLQPQLIVHLASASPLPNIARNKKNV